MLLFWYFLGGMVVGGILYSFIIFSICTAGTIKIDHSDPKKDVYRLEVDNLDDLTKTKRVILKVDNNANISQD